MVYVNRRNSYQPYKITNSLICLGLLGSLLGSLLRFFGTHYATLLVLRNFSVIFPFLIGKNTFDESSSITTLPFMLSKLIWKNKFNHKPNVPNYA